ncbi:Hsp70 family protein [Corynebacterium sp. 335C]
MTPWHLAIDFGTTNTAAAHADDGARPAVLALTDDGASMPSAVFAGDDGLYVGVAAVARAAADPSAFTPAPKRAIEMESVRLGSRDVPVAELVAAVLHRVLERARAAHGGTDPETVTLTHPEAWPPRALENLRAAAVLAGVPEAALREVSEPRAAARFHAAAAAGSDPAGRVAVFDFGGGTLDVAVLERDGADFRVVAARGDNSLGGRTVDARLRDHVIARLEDDDPDRAAKLRSAAPGATAAFDEAVRAAKETLSESPEAVVSLDDGTLVTVTRGELEELLADDVARAADMTEATLREAGADPAETTLHLAGGSSAVPCFRAELERRFRVTTAEDPKTVVARGALAVPAAGEEALAPAPAESAAAGGSASGDGVDPSAGSAAVGAGPAGAGAAGAAATAAAQPAAPARPGASDSVDHPATAEPQDDGSRGLALPILGIVVLAAVLGTAAFFGTRAFLERDSGGEQAQAAPAAAAPAPQDGPRTPVPLPAGAPIQGLPEEFAEALPEAYADHLEKCWEDTAPDYQCFWKDPDGQEQRVGVGSTHIHAGRDVAERKKNEVDAERGGRDVTRVGGQGGGPMAYLYGPSGDGGYAVHYLDREAGLYVTAEPIGTREQADAFIADLGLEAP